MASEPNEEPNDDELLERRHQAIAKEREDLLARRAEIDEQLSQLDIRIQAWANYKATLEGKFRPPTAAASRERKPGPLPPEPHTVIVRLEAVGDRKYSNLSNNIPRGSPPSRWLRSWESRTRKKSSTFPPLFQTSRANTSLSEEAAASLTAYQPTRAHRTLTQPSV